MSEENALNLADPDGFYAALMLAHQGLSEEESAALNARLVLILANAAGDEAALRAIKTARENLKGS
ncbi:DUF2783 domain-containing protein [Afifella pfennigii]|uniref:DUF2783 domain-containing protein n=1 Tax=Afifella pfennigii TaxID=209897 RepID=UPI0005554CB2|nr:DUF2783 domain-containing protein [Afifella pfennigii]